ncbi:Cyclin-dependent kinase 2 [Tritrichomonas foetus]|uniref:Cyclin-dependent kinase 2 n=1 Tax=Tritrichomonas foetus TaxID=1144522 RepID=A0A1J4KRU2_9EUKA|nr:Cyclin-dependent kinase 2 [Tritrichomonas foetus]|eukprot:OHT14009.1 Cyclin-dependent kinase 2 [Tritrichomonas foetus]
MNIYALNKPLKSTILVIFFDSPFNSPLNDHKHQNFEIEIFHFNQMSDTFENSYEIITHIGTGGYGKVFKARNKETGEIFTIKRMLNSNNKKDNFQEIIHREINAFSAISNLEVDEISKRNVANLRDVIYSETKSYVYLVFDYFEYDLSDILKKWKGIPVSFAKSYFHQLLQGLKIIHQAGFLHRDIKPHNIVLSPGNIVKITDLGLSRNINYDCKRPMTNQIITMWYKPPEILLGATQYGPEVDVWSLGCTFYEMMTGEPLFVGGTESEVYTAITNSIGSPNEENWPEWSRLPNASIFSKRNHSNVDANKFFMKHLPEQYQEARFLLMKMLQISPSKRITIQESLNDPYLNGSDVLPPEKLPMLTFEEVSKDDASLSPKRSSKRSKPVVTSRKSGANQNKMLRPAYNLPPIII